MEGRARVIPDLRKCENDIKDDVALQATVSPEVVYDVRDGKTTNVVVTSGAPWPDAGFGETREERPGRRGHALRRLRAGLVSDGARRPLPHEGREAPERLLRLRARARPLPIASAPNAYSVRPLLWGALTAQPPLLEEPSELVELPLLEPLLPPLVEPEVLPLPVEPEALPLLEPLLPPDPESSAPPSGGTVKLQ